ncbi:MAG: efflux RND transporter periplasmic adaptor subunit [Candidatus Melainabacteria bacterium]|nr:efflux RND transporter periplasmic adaptor subunit [Candidatus Melainabacteria bacterium]
MCRHPLINTPRQGTIQGVYRPGFFLACVFISAISVASLSACGTKSDSADASLSNHTEAPGAKLIKVSEKVAEQIDIRHEPIQKRALTVPLHVTGKIEPELGKEVDVTSRINGRVKEIRVAPGQEVKRGQIMAMLDSQEVSDLQAEFIEARSKLNIAQAHEDRERLIYNELLVRPKALIEAQARFNSAKVQKELAESEYRRQDGLYKEKISSQKDYLSSKAGFATAVAAHEQAKVDFEREQNMFKNKAMLRKDLQLSEAETARERQHFNTLKQRLDFLGADTSLLTGVLKTGQISGMVRIVAPESGVVSHHDIAVGELVHPEKSMFKVTDLTTVVVKADLPEVDVSRVRLGGNVKVKVTSYPNEDFRATISYIAEHVNPETRTVSVRARLDNRRRIFKLQMFAEIDLEGVSRELLACPKSAVQELEGKTVVFVKKEGGYEERLVKLGVDSEKYYEVVSGLSAGEEIVTQGSLMLKTELTYKH